MIDYKKQALLNVQARGRAAQALFDKKMQDVYSNPVYQEVSKNYSQICIENRRREVYQDKLPDYETESELKKELDLLFLGAKIGNPKPDYNCTICEDTGFDGARTCKCVRTEMSKLLMRDNGLEHLQEFEQSINNVDERTKQIYNKLLQWCETSTRTKDLIFLTGAVGVGKTHLAKCMAKKLIDCGKIVNFTSAVKMAYDTRQLSDEVLHHYSRVEVLVIDDLGTENITSKTIQALYIILSERKEKHLLTIITTNLTPADIDNTYGERIYSRLVERTTSICFELIGEDRRTTLNINPDIEKALKHAVENAQEN